MRRPTTLAALSIGLLACTNHPAMNERHTQLLTGTVNTDTSGAVIHQTEQSLYIGQMKNGKPHGQGTWYLKGKMVFTGTWQDGELQGDATIIGIETNSVSSGTFIDGKQTGIGYVEQNNQGYYGEVDQGIPKGKGKCLVDEEIIDCQY